PRFLRWRMPAPLELRLRGPDDLVGGPGFGRAEQVPDLSEGEPQPPGPPDESQPPPVRLGVLAVSGTLALRQRQQPTAVVEPHRFDADPFGGGELAHRQPGYAGKLAAVPRYGVNTGSQRRLTARGSRPQAGAGPPLEDLDLRFRPGTVAGHRAVLEPGEDLGGAGADV